MKPRDISEIDRNFKVSTVGDKEIIYFNALEAPFQLEGFPWYPQHHRLYRLPGHFTLQHVNQGELDLAKRIGNLLLNPTSNVDRALSIVTERLEVPEVPKTMYELTFQLQKLKDQDLLVQRYLLVFGSCCLSLTL